MTKPHTCPDCGFSVHLGHICPPLWNVTEDDATIGGAVWTPIHAPTPSRAAERYVEQWDIDLCTFSKETTVMVVADDGPPGEHWFIVGGELVPQYTAARVLEASAND